MLNEKKKTGQEVSMVVKGFARRGEKDCEAKTDCKQRVKRKSRKDIKCPSLGPRLSHASLFLDPAITEEKEKKRLQTISVLKQELKKSTEMTAKTIKNKASIQLITG